MDSPLAHTRRLVIKLGTGILTSGIGERNTARIDGICTQVAQLQRQGKQILIVSSGAVGMGMGRLGLKKRPTKLSSLQKCAAIGQSLLIENWQRGFNPFGLHVAQLLLTREEVRSRNCHVAFRDLLEELLSEGIIPIINENDSVSTDEFKFGDNDILAALIASVIKAGLLTILSTAPGLIDRKGDGSLISVVEMLTPEIEAMAEGSSSATAVGGMISKLQAAKIATQSGCGLFIGSGHHPEILSQIFTGQARGTFFIPAQQKLSAHKRWLAFFEQPKGMLEVDAGAEKALREMGSSLLAKGVTGYSGSFAKGDNVDVARPDGIPFARGITQFDHRDLAKIVGKDTQKIQCLFPHRRRCEVIHRDALVRLG